jgi:hypothetical protein
LDVSFVAEGGSVGDGGDDRWREWVSRVTRGQMGHVFDGVTRAGAASGAPTKCPALKRILHARDFFRSAEALLPRINSGAASVFLRLRRN